ncbi:response regulator [Oligoflexia bacterium]|nr:response regulator [Oligoflexia bacterium]
MLTVENSKQVFLKAILLGFAALALNQIAYAVLPGQLPFGNLLIFLSAGALGAPGAIISAATGVIPETLCTGEHIYGLRILLLSSTIGYCATRLPRLPSFIVCFSLWLCLFGPYYIFMGTPRMLNAYWTPEYVIFSGFSEVILTLISGTLLLSPTIWRTLTYRNRHVETSFTLTHAVTLIACLGVCAALILPHMTTTPEAINAYYSGSIQQIFLLITAVTITATYLGWKIPLLIKFCSPSNLLAAQSGKIFAGSELDYWGREDSPPRQLDAVVRDNYASTTLSSIYHAWTENNIDGICAIDQNGTITFVNERFQEITDIENKDALGQKINDLEMLPRFHEHLKECFEKTLSRGPFVSEFKLNSLPDELRYYEFTTQYSDTSDDDNVVSKLDGVLITVRDITDRRTVESHLLQAQKVKSLGEVIGGVAHAFNNSLTTILGQASFAQRVSDPKLVDKSLGEIVAAANSASELVWKLLEFAEGRPNLMKAADIDQLIRNHLDILDKIAGEKVEIKYVGPKHPTGIVSDSNLLIQALTNIIINSKEAYRERAGEITISIDIEDIDDEVSQLLVGARPGKFVRLKIQDEGSGMSPETLSKAFKPLFTSKQNRGQAGLGLSIVFAIVRAHDGFLAAESYPEKGTTISIYLPWIELPQQDTEAQAAKIEVDGSQEADKANDEKILVVEDEPTVRALVAQMLSTLGYKVDSCSNGPEALHRCRQAGFDLVLVDLMMPKMSGLEVIERLKATENSAKALIMTGYGVTHKTVDLATTIINKPFDMNTLASTVRATLDE